MIDLNKYLFSAFAIISLSVPLAIAQDADSDVEEVVVTGSRIIDPNVISSSQIATIDGQDIIDAGITRVEDFLNDMPQVSPGQSITNSNGSNGTATVNLRNMGCARTLVLMNGRRMVPGTTGGGSCADLNTIPTLLLKRVEVLTGGASSVYGSDAVAGVVNIILVDGLEKNTVRVVAGSGVGQGTGGEYVNLEFAGGGFTDKMSYTYALEYTDEQSIPIKSRSEHDSYLDGSSDVPIPSRGLLIRDTYYYGLHIYPDQLIGPDGQPAGRTCPQADPGYTLATPEQSNAYVASYFGSYCGFDSSSNGSLTNAREKASVYLSGTYEISDKIEAYAKVVHLTIDTQGTLDNLFTPFVWVAGPQPYGTSFTTQGLGHYPVPSNQPAAGGFASMMDFRIQKIFSNFIVAVGKTSAFFCPL